MCLNKCVTPQVDIASGPRELFKVITQQASALGLAEILS